MVEITNVKVYDIFESIIAAGYAMGVNLEDFAGRAENIEFWSQNKEFFFDFVRHYNSQNKNIGQDTLESCFKCGKPARQRVNTGNGGGHYYCSKHSHELYRYGSIIDDEVYEFVDKNTVKVTIKGDQHKVSSFLISAIDVPLVFKKNKNIANNGYVKCDGKLLHLIIADKLGIRSKQIDHINRNRVDNRRENIRPCTPSQNIINRECKGISFDKSRNKWKAFVTVDGKQFRLRRFDSEEDALRYRLELERKIYGEFAPNAHLFEKYGIESVVKSSFPLSQYSLKDAVQDFNRVVRLVNASSRTDNSHCNFLKGIRVSFDIKYPNYFSPELQRYHFMDIVCSSSKMHRILVMADKPEFYNKYVNQKSLDNMRELVSEYNIVCDTGDKDDQYEAFMRVLSNCPQGIELFMRCSTNYMQLRNIYHQRKTHRLREDWQEGFCKFIEELPYFKEFINPE